MYYFSFQAEFEDQLYSLQPSLFFNDVVTLKDRVDLSRKIITHTLYYIRRVPFWMLAVYCVDGLNVYYQMLQHIAQCVQDFSIRYIRYTPGWKSIYIDAWSNRSSPVEFVQNMSQYSFISIIIHLLINI